MEENLTTIPDAVLDEEIAVLRKRMDEDRSRLRLLVKEWDTRETIRRAEAANPGITQRILARGIPSGETMGNLGG